MIAFRDGPWPILLVAVLAVGLYLPSLGHGFHYDDFHSLVRNPHIRSLDNVGVFLSDPGAFSVNPESAMFRPLLLLSYALTYAATGASAWAFHAVNALLHGVNVVLLYLLLLAVRLPRGQALLAAAIFAATPLNSEAVNYVSSRSELIMACFFLAACLAYLRSRPNLQSADWRSAGLWLVASVVCAAGALLTKSVAIVLVAALVLIDWRLGGVDAVRRGVKFYVPFAVLNAVYIVWTSSIIDRALLQPARGLSVQLWTQIKAAVYYIQLAILPVELTVEHQFQVSRTPDAAVVAAALLVVSLAAVTLSFAKHRQLAFACLWWVVLLLPSAIVPLIVLVNEHRLYLASAGFCMAVAVFLWQLRPHRRVATAAAGLYTISLAASVLQRGPAWADELSLWQDAAAKAPLMLKPHLRSADALGGAGRLAEAEAAYLRAVALRPQHPAARNNLGQLYMRMRRPADAEEQFRALLASSPDNVPARLNLANTRLRRKDWEGARSEYATALEYGDTGGIAQGHLARIALRDGRDPLVALCYFEAALELAGEAAVRVQLLSGKGVALRALGRLDQAEAAYLAALQMDSLAVDARYNLGNLYVQIGRLAEARQAFASVIDMGSDEVLSASAQTQLQRLTDGIDKGE